MSLRVFLNNSFAMNGLPTGWVVGREQARNFVTLDENDVTMPSDLKGMVEMVSWWEVVRDEPHREFGEYPDEGAQAVVDHYDYDSNGRRVLIKIHGVKLEDVRRLYSEIRGGKVRPTLSYEAPQGGMSHQELVVAKGLLERNNTALNADLNNLRSEIEALKAELLGAQAEIDELRTRLGEPTQMDAAVDTGDFAPTPSGIIDDGPVGEEPVYTDEFVEDDGEFFEELSRWNRFWNWLGGKLA